MDETELCGTPISTWVFIGISIITGAWAAANEVMGAKKTKGTGEYACIGDVCRKMMNPVTVVPV